MSKLPQFIPVEHDPFSESGELQDFVAATDSQKEIWVALQLQPEANLAYNESITIRLEGPMQAELLRKAVEALPEFHDALRVTMSGDGHDLCFRKIPAIAWSTRDLSQTSAQEAQLADEARQATLEPFHLRKGPLVRFRLLTLSPHRHELLISGHHIILDGWSLAVLVKDLFLFYRQLSQGQRPSKRTIQHLSAYARERLQDRADKDLTYWKNKFQTVPILELPTKGPRPAHRTFAAGIFFRSFDLSLIKAAKAQARQHRSSFVNYLLAAFSLVLQQVSGQDEIVIGLPAAGQSIYGQAELVGHCVHLLPLRYHLSPELSWLEYLVRCRGQFLEDWEHPHITFGRLLQELPIARDPSRIPLVSVVFNIDTKIPKKDLTLDSLTADYTINPRQFETFELFINCVDTEDRFEICCQYNQDLFDESLIATLFGGLERLLGQILARPTSRLMELSITDLDALQTVNQDPRSFDRATSLPQAFLTQARQTPESVALICGTHTWTYKRLQEDVQRFAAHLLGYGVRPGDRIGVCLPRREELLVSLLAIMHCGASYVPLDPAFPSLRLAMIAEDAELHLCLVMPETTSMAPRSCSIVNIENWLSEAPSSGIKQEAVQQPDQLAYIMFTSGSTGRPKGVMITQRALMNFLIGMAHAIRYQPDQRLLAVTTSSFDISILELFMPLIHGGSLVLAPSESVKDGYQLRELITRHDVRIMQATPSGWNILLLADFQPPSPGFVAICGGEPLPRSLIEELLSRQMQVWNAYGPTEATVWASVQEIKEIGAPIWVGHVLPNYEVWVLDSWGRPLPFGCKGELALAGEGLALGYYGRPDLTTERFVIDASGRRLYRTGDIARLHADGSIELFGRNDSQVKVRGHRIELDEIKVALESLPTVREAIVLTQSRPGGTGDLLAYLRLRDGVQFVRESLIDQLQQSLPPYMIPQYVTVLEQFPLLPNGKIDRKALPDPEPNPGHTEREVFTPLTPSEDVLYQLWKQSLRVEQAFTDDDFFIRGGHSLLAMQLIAQLNHELGLDLRMHHLLQHATLGAFAKLLPQDKPEKTQSIPRRRPGDRRVSLAQKRMWFVERAEQGSLVHNLPGAWRFIGAFDVDACNRAFLLLLERHEVLGMTIQTSDGEPLQQIHEHFRDYRLPFRDLSQEADPLALCKREMEQAAAMHLPIDSFPLFHAILYCLGHHDHVLFFMPHHIIWDGWCFDILLEELAAAYLHQTQGVALPALPSVSYGDYSSWQSDRLEGPQIAQQLAYWQNVFANLPEPLELPQDIPRPPEFTHEAGVVDLHLDTELTASLERFCQVHSCTPYMMMLACFSLGLGRYAGQHDLVIGTPVRGRHRAELERMLGVFINIVPLRITIDDRLSFLEFIARIRSLCSESFAHDEIPFELLLSKLPIRRDQSRSVLYSAILSYQDVSSRSLKWGDVSLEQLRVDSPITPTDLFFWVKKGRDSMSLGLDYYRGLWKEDTARAFLQTMKTLISTALIAPHERVRRLPSVANQHWQVHSEPSVPQERVFPWTDVGSYLHAASEPHGARIALRFRGKALRYDQLWQKATRCAASLQALELLPGGFVGIAMERTEHLVVALLGTWLAGGAYLPLDPQYPAERLAMMIEDSGTRLILVDEELLDAIPQTAHAKKIAFEELPLTASTFHPPALQSSHPAYIIYTSGSTGKPKGVVISHGAVLNFLLSIQEAIPFGDAPQTLAITTISFDISVLEFFVTLARAGTIHLCSSSEAMDASRLTRYLDTTSISVLQATPVTWRLLLDSGWKGSPHLLALTGGEALSQDLARRLKPKVGKLYNVYGPTEATVWATYAEIKDPEAPITIGRALPSYQVYVMDAQLQVCAPGMPGDLYIAGPSLAIGYHQRPDLTQQRFILAPWDSSLRLYDTGDRVRRLPNGQIQYLGRRDTQVKLRGYRIELEEIEKTLLRYPGIERAIAIIREDRPGDQRLVAYTISRQVLDTKSMLHTLGQSLPRYMLPNVIVPLETLPLTANGKIDRKRLPAPDWTSPSSEARTLPRYETERMIADIWKDLLDLPHVYIDDNFFDLGGHSLLAIEAIQRIRKATSRDVLVRDIVLQTLEQVANSLMNEDAPKRKLV
jgi:amino acid adenylation domain-containing protein